MRGESHSTTLALRIEGQMVDGAIEASTRQKRRFEVKVDEDKATVMNDRTEKEPPT